MARVSFTFDNRKAANQFISSLDKKTRNARFSSAADWRPRHLALAAVDNHVVAMADCSLTDDGLAANGSLVARPGYGAYAVAALLKLKKHVKVPYWFATLREPTPATIAVSRRHFDEVFDQGAWELSNELMLRYGKEQHFRPFPLATTDRFLKLAGLPKLKDLDEASRHQVFQAASPEGGISLISPNGFDIGASGALGIAFDLLSTSMKDRQNFARIMLLGMAAMHGHRLDGAPVKKVADPSALGRVAQALEQARAPALAGGIFQIAKM
ncbi:hypothetical protein AUSSIE_53 [Sinorhizobium phage Aussie]|nr:hypothetical protein AUSSIE_53 [Sinorhizobium phage Aussie]